MRCSGAIPRERTVVRASRRLVFARFPFAQRDMHFGRRSKRANGLFAFMQCAHALDFDGYRLLQRGANRPGPGCAPRLAKDAVGALSGIQVDRLQELRRDSVISFSWLHDRHQSLSLLICRPPRRGVGQNIADGDHEPQSDAN